MGAVGSVRDADNTQRSLDLRIAALSSSHHGVFSRRMAVGAGATKDAIRRRIESGRWRVVDRDVFAMAGTPITWRSRLVGACLSLGDGSFVSHMPAASLWSLPGFEGEPTPEVIAHRRKKRKVPGRIIHWAGPLPQADCAILGGIPITTPSRTIIDIAQRISEGSLEEALDDALRRRLTSIPRMRWHVARAGRRPGIATVRALLDARDPSARPSESVLETRVARILRKAKLPGLVPQHDIVIAGRVIARIDFAFPEAKVAVEADGYSWHSGRAQWQQDLERRNALTNLGWRVIHVTWEDLTRPQVIVDQIEQALRARLF